MTINFVNGGAVVWATANTATVGYPAGAATDAVVAFAAGKPVTFTPSQANYTELGTVNTGSVANATDEGSVRNGAFLRTTSPTGSASDSWSLLGSPSPALLRTLRFGRSAGVGWLTAYTGLVDSDESGTAVTATAAVTAGQYAAGDMVAVTVITKSDSIIHTNQVLTIPGVVLDTPTWFARYLTTTGADGSAYSGYALVLSGTSTAGDATYSATSNVTGGAATAVSMVRLREDPGGASETHTTSGTARAEASAAATTTTARTKAGTAPAVAAAISASTSLRTKTGAAAAVAAAAGGAGSVHTTTGTAPAAATASAATTKVEAAAEVRVTQGNATATASAAAITATARLATGTARAVALVGGDTATRRVTTGAATAHARAYAEVTTERITAGTALAYATAVADTVNPSRYRDITVTVAGPTGHALTVAPPTGHRLTVGRPEGNRLTVTGPRS